METGKLIFVTGGVRSGKSSYAEKMAERLGSKLESNLHYLACGIASDQEMAARIDRHRKDRENSSGHWETWECPYHLERVARHFSKKDVLVLDCVTTLLNNYLFDRALHEHEWLIDCLLTDINSLRENSAWLIVVSNEVTQGLAFEEPLTRSYQYILGQVHQRIVEQADAAYLIEYGIPVCKKGATK